jgi:hypothetical protein
MHGMCYDGSNAGTDHSFIIITFIITFRTLNTLLLRVLFLLCCVCCVSTEHGVFKTVHWVIKGGTKHPRFCWNQSQQGARHSAMDAW